MPSMQTPDVLELPKFYVSVFGVALSLVAGIVALKSFLRSEKWKKAEFLAKEMKDFFGDERIQKTLQLIDWGVRRIQLSAPEADSSGKVVVTRALQVRALRPHIFLQKNVSDAEAADSDTEMTTSDGETAASEVGSLEKFEPSEVAIRDCYDAFLDGLERLSSYIQTGLIDVAALSPYIGYWIDDIHATTTSHADAAWTASLLTYISFYRFEGVLCLFDAFGRGIRPSSDAYRGFLAQMSDQVYATKLANSVKITYP